MKNLIKLFEELGFEKKHELKADTRNGAMSMVRMNDANGFAVDVTDMQSQKQDSTFIRMNVDDFDEAMAKLTESGFKNLYGDLIIEIDHARIVFMQSVSGFVIELVKHIKK